MFGQWDVSWWWVVITPAYGTAMVMFSILSVCQPFCLGAGRGKGSLYRAPYHPLCKALALPHPIPPCTDPWPTLPFQGPGPQTCSNLFNLDLMDCREAGSWHSTGMPFCFLFWQILSSNIMAVLWRTFASFLCCCFFFSIVLQFPFWKENSQN